jgi:hypothetical protein
MPAGAPDPTALPMLRMRTPVTGYTDQVLDDSPLQTLPVVPREQVRAAGQKLVRRPTAPTQRMRIINPDQIYLNGSLIDNGPAFPPTTPLVWY